MRLRIMLFVLLTALPLASAVADDHHDDDHNHHGHTHAAVATTEEDVAAGYSGSAPAVVELATQRFAVVKGTIGSAYEVQMLISELTAEQGLLDENSQAWSLVPHMPASEEEVPATEYWAARSISDSAEPSGDLESFVAPGGKYAMARHVGSYEGLGASWGAFIMQTMSSATYDPSRPLLEHYHSDPETTPEDELITLLYIPIE